LSAIPGRQSQTVGWATARWSAGAADELDALALGTGVAAGDDDPLELEQPLASTASSAAPVSARPSAIALS
jgi:hypothetical protein